MGLAAALAAALLAASLEAAAAAAALDGPVEMLELDVAAGGGHPSRIECSCDVVKGEMPRAWMANTIPEGRVPRIAGKTVHELDEDFEKWYADGGADAVEAEIKLQVLAYKQRA